MAKKQPYKFKVYITILLLMKLEVESFAILVIVLGALMELFLVLQWNEYMDKDHRDSYYHNWPIYFP